MAVASYSDRVIVQMFEWPWASIESECSFLGQAGYSYIQISPPSEHVLEPEWFSSYAPVSYQLTSKRGNQEDLASMIRTCNSEGVQIIVDAVINHMTSTGGVSIAGTTFEKYSYPNYDPSNFHYCNGNGTASQITNYDNATDVKECEFSGLADLDQEQEVVQSTIKGYLNSLIELGVSGFRVDAAMLIEYNYLYDILSGLQNTTELLITQEISAPTNTTPEEDRPETYFINGLVHDFNAAYDLLRLFTTTIDIGVAISPLLWGEAWGYTPSNISNIFVTNHDTERNGGTLTWKSPNNSYSLATYFMLGYPYATPTVFSGFNFTDPGQPAPENNVTGITDQIICGQNGRRCEHRWPGFANMAMFRNKSAGQPLSFVSGSGNRISFGRGNVGFLAINNEEEAWSATFQTGLPPGQTYCNIISGTLTNCSSPMTVASDGTVEATLGSFDALAMIAM